MSGGRSRVGHQHVGPKPIELLAADAFYLAEVFDLRERTVRSAVFDHPLRQLGTDPRQCFQIRECGMIEINAPGWVRTLGVRVAGPCRRCRLLDWLRLMRD